MNYWYSYFLEVLSIIQLKFGETYLTSLKVKAGGKD